MWFPPGCNSPNFRATDAFPRFARLRIIGPVAVPTLPEVRSSRRRNGLCPSCEYISLHDIYSRAKLIASSKSGVKGFRNGCAAPTIDDGESPGLDNRLPARTVLMDRTHHHATLGQDALPPLLAIIALHSAILLP